MIYDIVSLNNEVGKKMRMILDLNKAAFQYYKEIIAENKARQDKVTDDVRFKMEHRWSVQEQKEMLKEVRHHMRSPPVDMVAEQVDVHQKIDWPIMEHELASNLGLKPEDRK